MSGFDPSSIAQTQDVDLSERSRKKLRAICKRLEDLGLEDNSEEAFDYFEATLSELETSADERGARESKLLRGALYFVYAEQHLECGEFDEAGEYIDQALEAGWRTRQA